MACISTRAYGTVAAPPDPASLYARRKTIRRWSIIGTSTALLVAVAVVAAVSISGHKSNSGGNVDAGAGSAPASLSTAIKAVCSGTLYPNSCLATLAPIVNSPDRALDPVKLFHVSAQAAIAELSKVSGSLQSLTVNGTTDRMSTLALDACYELIELAIDHLNNSITSNGTGGGLPADDQRSWLSAAITYQHTCMDAFDFDSAAAPLLKERVFFSLKNSTEFASNSLAIFNQVYSLFGSVGDVAGADDVGGFPAWVPTKDRKLLQSTPADPRKIADIVVASDGSGRYRSIKAALAAVKEKSEKRTIIYVKKGVYFENVRVEKNKWNVMLVGDGMGFSVVSGKLNVVDGTPTFSTATVAVFGKGFIGRDITFRNTAGPAKQQAVALMSDSDQSAFYRCRFDAYQDTLYTHSLRQFYRDCEIYGTVDFIFGNAAAVLQSCTILPRRPIQGQQDTITAQGKTDPNQNTGISVHQCTVKPYGDLTGVRVYLGRPWKPYSTTVFMKSSLAGIIDPAGWLPWTGNSAPDTIFYSEYQNFGAGASTAKRVKWKGLRTMDVRQASKFTAAAFVGGDSWVPKAGVPYKSGL
ncbi:putative pectinesterase/pectinesterase inhibitor 24 [Platanthera zijinensis]|uniref:Pectinesterase n=1 Tax=Platanthera zijinensis TaxID=2320716 RepID=A0AAP0BJ16_9ASPA